MKPRLMSLIFLLERWKTPIPSLDPVTEVVLPSIVTSVPPMTSATRPA